jgi:hypothetical protein
MAGVCLCAVEEECMHRTSLLQRWQAAVCMTPGGALCCKQVLCVSSTRGFVSTVLEEVSTVLEEEECAQGGSLRCTC